ncbi:MAG: ribosome small subunit-dependent GTPase A [Nocardioidaceae bacterium]
MTGPRVQLEDLGWDDSWREALMPGTPHAEDAGDGQGCPGRVVRVDRGLCTVLTMAGPVRASLGGDVLSVMATDPLAAPCTGDWCLVRQWPDGPLTVETLAARRTSLVRAGAARSSHGQVMAANVDTVALVVALHPEPNLGRIERLLGVAWESNASPLVVLTKIDQVVDGDAIAADVRVAAPGVEVVCCSATTGQGVDAIRAMLHHGRTMVMVGASGHGKSTLTNALVGADVLTTRAIRDDGKGRHTSVRRELLVVPGGGAIIDTPGLRGVGLQRDEVALRQTFPDIDPLTEHCRFRDCHHETEPGCAITAALAAGELSVRRWESWQKLNRELAWAERRTDARLRAEQAKRWRDITKQTRGRGRR